jgi:hypothetical protein
MQIAVGMCGLCLHTHLSHHPSFVTVAAAAATAVYEDTALEELCGELVDVLGWMSPG